MRIQENFRALSKYFFGVVCEWVCNEAGIKPCYSLQEWCKPEKTGISAEAVVTCGFGWHCSAYSLSRSFLNRLQKPQPSCYLRLRRSISPKHAGSPHHMRSRQKAAPCSPAWRPVSSQSLYCSRKSCFALWFAKNRLNRFLPDQYTVELGNRSVAYPMEGCS